ncbi:MAG: triose-phosphate isomerase, partial [Patescibacteria group bacterium]
KRVSFNQIAESLNRAREVGFFTVVCARDLKEAKEIAALNPDAVAIEPPELIGGNVSVSTASPEVIASVVKALPNMSVIVGAGVKTGEDIAIALRLGAKGVLVASGVTRAQDPRKVLVEFAKALRGK